GSYEEGPGLGGGSQFVLSRDRRDVQSPRAFRVAKANEVAEEFLFFHPPHGVGISAMSSFQYSWPKCAASSDQREQHADEEDLRQRFRAQSTEQTYRANLPHRLKSSSVRWLPIPSHPFLS